MTPEPDAGHIAVIGLSCRYPGASGPEEFWRNLVAGVDSITRLPPRPIPAGGDGDGAYVPAGGFLTDPEWFDAGYFGFTPREARIIDPQQRVFLECAVEALENAGCDPDRHPGAIGVYAGGSDTEYAAILRSRKADLPSVTNWEIRLATGADFLSTRVAYKLGLRGPAVTVRAACATSLVAVHLAAQSLLAGDCDVALAGGACVHVPAAPAEYTEGGIVATDGVCRAFDAAAQGIVSGNGAGVVVLKRLPEAVEDGDPIRAVIRGSAINNDGADRIGFTAPGVAGQAAAIRGAQLLADVDPGTVTYVEAHGTATPIGDPIEVAALTEVFGAASGRRGHCALGSVKPNIGHTDTAAGVAGLIKTVMAVERAVIPPSLHFTEPNPEIDFTNGPFRVVTEPTPWRPEAAPRRAGVSSFGMGGANAHVVVEEPPSRPAPAPPAPQLLVLSAMTAAALDAAAVRLADHLRAHPELPLDEVAWTLQTGRRRLPYRAYAVVDGHDDAVRVLAGRDPGRLITAESHSHAPDAYGGPLEAAGRHWLAREPVAWEDLRGARPAKVALPTYPFERLRHVVDPPAVSPEAPATRPVTGRAVESGVRPVVAGLFAEMLGLPPGDLDPDDSFFDLGGDSLVATQVLVKIRQAYHVELTLRAMLEAPTATAFATLVEKLMGGDGDGG
ncbi:MAG TPA: beta-ketoacyl synthase N-terminal-like domain-containing protein [Streptosporangiaceae bacterium]|jgi:polyketide synthase PksJ